MNTEKIEIIRIPILKRLFDIIVSITIIVGLSPVMVVMLLLYYLEQRLFPRARGPLLYKEIRISQGKPFNFYKIRTFTCSALEKKNEGGIIHTKNLEADFRNLTVMGMVLIQTYLDEFPQLFLVLLGKMSLVGPRPTNPEAYERGFTAGLRAKTILRAGLTGYFQTHKSVKFKLNQEQVDMEYANFCKNNSGFKVVARDLKMLILTVFTLIRAEGL